MTTSHMICLSHDLQLSPSLETTLSLLATSYIYCLSVSILLVRTRFIQLTLIQPITLGYSSFFLVNRSFTSSSNRNLSLSETWSKWVPTIITIQPGALS